MERMRPNLGPDVDVRPAATVIVVCDSAAGLEVLIASALRSASVVPPPIRIEPRLRFDAEGERIGVSIPGDDDYDDWV